MSAPSSEAAFGLQLLQTDTLFARIPESDRLRWVCLALRDGRRLARVVRQGFGEEPFAIAAGCNVPVIESESDASFGSTIVYADYAVKTSTITLYMPAICQLDALLAADAGFPWGIEQTAPVFLAHELYHHFDCLRGERALARRFRLPVVRTGSWAWRAGLSTLPEIAAGAFAQQLLRLNFHPKLLDALVKGKVLS